MRKILYVGWIGFDNLGDELMWHVFRDLATKYLNTQTHQVIPSMPGVDLHDFRPYDTVVLGGGSLLVPGYVDVAHRAVQQKKRLVIWGSGYDSQLPVKFDATGKLLTASFQESPKMQQMLREIGEHAQYFGVRGPLTHEYLREMGVGGSLQISGDPGMLMTPPDGIVHGEEHPPMVGINWGTAYNRIYGKNEAVVEDALAQVAKTLIQHGFGIYLYTMWGPDRGAIRRLYQKIGAPERVTLDLELHDHNEMMRRLSRCQATINFKLHANVLSAVAGVPFVCLAYRFKCLDFCYSLSLPEMAIPTDHPQLRQQILTRTVRAMDEQASLRDLFVSQRKETADRLSEPFFHGDL